MSERIVVLDNFTSSGVAATRHFCNINSVAAAVLCAVQVWHFLPVQWKSSGSQRGSTTQEMPTGTLSPWYTLICRYSNSTHDLLDMWVVGFFFTTEEVGAGVWWMFYFSCCLFFSLKLFNACYCFRTVTGNRWTLVTPCSKRLMEKPSTTKARAPSIPLLLMRRPIMKNNRHLWPLGGKPW